MSRPPCADEGREVGIGRVIERVHRLQPLEGFAVEAKVVEPEGFRRIRVEGDMADRPARDDAAEDVVRAGLWNVDAGPGQFRARLRPADRQPDAVRRPRSLVDFARGLDLSAVRQSAS